MRPETLDLLCNPYKGEPFVRDGNTLIGIASKQTFPIRDSIPVILTDASTDGLNRRSKLIYDLTAAIYDPIVTLGDNLGLNTEGRVRRDYIASLEINPGDRVLETAAGTASNLFHLPEQIEYYGLDISLPMLKCAKRKASDGNREAEFIQADGAYIPFRDESMNLVFQMGGLQFMQDPFRAVSEMARVAKPGAQIHVIDELRGAIQTLGRMLAHSKYATKEKAVEGMKRLVPQSMTEIESQMIEGTHFYALRFRKPSLPKGKN
jgi:ubiquinone/menaquinone biosynthesis C-methylase UbiE